MIGGVLMLVPIISLADQHNSIGDGSSSLGVSFQNPFGNTITSIPQFIGALVDLLINFGGVLVVFFLILSGFMFVLAVGRPEKISKARKVLMWTLIGAVVLIGSRVIAEVIRATLSQFTG